MSEDAAWKEVLTHLFQEFMEFFFPHIAADIDFSCGYKFLDKEFQQIVRGAETGRRIVDKLVQVCLKNGKEKWILIHIEVQGQGEGLCEADVNLPQSHFRCVSTGGC